MIWGAFNLESITNLEKGKTYKPIVFLSCQQQTKNTSRSHNMVGGIMFSFLYVYERGILASSI